MKYFQKTCIQIWSWAPNFEARFDQPFILCDSHGTDYIFKFTTHLSNGRRSLLYQLRSQTAHEIFGQPSKYYAVDWNREDIQDFQSKIKFPEQAGYKKFAPILFPDGKRDFKKLFKRIELTKVGLS